MFEQRKAKEHGQGFAVDEDMISVTGEEVGNGVGEGIEPSKAPMDIELSKGRKP